MLLWTTVRQADLKVRPYVQKEGRLKPAPTKNRYRASGSGRIWNFTIFPRVPLPPSMCHTKCVP